jgi:SAM-dependent methyltransferase
MNVFDRAVKKEQRNAAARNPYLLEDYEYLRDEVASRLIDRLDDFARELPVALDLGCHSGNIHRALLDGDDASWVKGGITTLTQCDSSPAMLELAKESAAKIGHEGVKVHSLVADEELLPFADDTFDVVLSSMSMHWVRDDLPTTHPPPPPPPADRCLTPPSTPPPPHTHPRGR